MEDYDYLLAVQLQQKFNEETRNKPSQSSPAPKHKSPVLFQDSENRQAKRLKPNTLVDPEWEVIDPTPDLHGLFMGFNKRFFWSTLGSVEVKWSPRMYSCAGVCSYQRRGGLCSIRVSEPLLKLRPRSDLVETLLHEMIHAYLFITNNDVDRDGHGPEFKKHMFRINKTAGTNITIYHDFHDEVKLYKVHWWRCNGSCQSKPPFFGTVKRSMNRAPGPSDFWWATHQLVCGGTYIKVREPAPKHSRTKKKLVSEKGGIKKYVVVSPKVPTNKSTSGLYSPIPSTSKGSPSYTVNKVTGFRDQQIKGKDSTTSSTFSGQGNKLVTNANKKGYGKGSAVMNKGSGTFTLTNKSGVVVSNSPSKSETFVPFSGTGCKLGGDSHAGTGRSKPVSSLLTLFDKKGCSNVERCKITNIGMANSDSSNQQNFHGTSLEKSKNDFMNESQSDEEFLVLDCDDDDDDDNLCGSQDDDRGDDDVHCPVCNTKINRDDMSIHLQSCDVLNSTFEDMNNSGTLKDDETVENVEDVQPNNLSSMLPCPCCSKLIVESDINNHLDECLSLLAIQEFNKDC